MGLMDIFVSKEELARREWETKLADPKVDVVALYKQADAKIMDLIISKKLKNKDQHNYQAKDKLANLHSVARLIKSMQEAKVALDNGDINPVVQIADNGVASYRGDEKKSGRYWAAFEELTSDKTDVNALKAKSALWPKYIYNNTGQLYYERPVVNFARDQALEAVEGYNQLGMLRECEEAMKIVIDNNNGEAMHVGSDYHEVWLNQFEEGKPENSVKGIAAINIAHQKDEKLSIAQSMAVVKRHPNEEFRVKAVNDIVDGQRSDRRRSKESFDFLLDHVVTADGNSTPSQLQALRRLNADYDDYIHPYQETGKEEEPKRFKDVITEEMHKNAPHVMGQMFNTSSKTSRFLRHSIVSSVIPFNLEGPTIADVRLHFAEQSLKEIIIPRYTDKHENEFNRSNPERYAAICQDVARLSADVLLDDSLKEGSRPKIQAEDNLLKVIQLEDLRAQKDQETAAKFSEGSDYYMQKHYQEVLAENQKHLGEGRKMLVSLEKYGTDEVMNLVGRINQRLDDKAKPSVEAQKVSKAPHLRCS